MMSNKIVPTGTSFDEKEMIWKGPKEVIETDTEASLGRSVLEILQREPDHIAQICDNNGRKYTNRDIVEVSICVSQHLEKMGFQQEDIIGICGSNTDFIAPLVFGALLCGTTLSTLDPSFDMNGIRHTFTISKPKIMFCDGNIYEKVNSALMEININIPIFTMKDHLEGVRRIDELISPGDREMSFNVKPLKVGLKQTAFILCSSGTTGLPKGVCVSHGSLLNTKLFNLSPDDKLLCFSTLYWASGIMSLFQGTLGGCTRIITDQVYSPELFLRKIEQYKVNIAFTPPSQMALAIQSPDIKIKDLSSLELYMCTGSAAPFAVTQTFHQYVKQCNVSVCYGMTELSGTCSAGRPTKPGCNGQLLPNVEIKLIDESGQQVGISKRGEICINPPFEWTGYYKNQTATDAIYSEGKWIHSGDCGYFDEEGSLVIVDRIKDILKYNNFHFFPTEIEEVINQIPGVLEVCVCGIPDAVFSFLPAAAVVKLPNSKLSEEEIIKYVAEKMEHFKQLRGGVYFMDVLPKTASGKNIRSKVTKIVEDLFAPRKMCSEFIGERDSASSAVPI